MRNLRLIARLDVKGPNLIKGVHLEGLRKIGKPQEFAKKYYKDGADELIYIDIDASLYQRSKLTAIVRETAKNVFVPLTVGGGIRSIKDASDMFKAGADKVLLNSAAIDNVKLLKKASKIFGSSNITIIIHK